MRLQTLCSLGGWGVGAHVCRGGLQVVCSLGGAGSTGPKDAESKELLDRIGRILIGTGAIAARKWRWGVEGGEGGG